MMEERLASEKVYDGRLFQVYRDRVRLESGREATREIVRHPGSVAIVPRDERGNVFLVRQFRYVTGRELWEVPAGTRDHPGEEVEATARRELEEEAGLEAQRWTRLGRAFLVPGYGDEAMTFFLAEGLSPTQGQAEFDESFKVNPFPLHDLRVLRATGELEDAKSLLALAWAGLDIFAEP
jgi:ADP-ribose diphosphatase